MRLQSISANGTGNYIQYAVAIIVIHYVRLDFSHFSPTSYAVTGHPYSTTYANGNPLTAGAD